MSSRKLSTRLGLDEETIRRLSNHSVTTAKDLFELPEPQMMVLLNMSPHQVRELLTQVASRCVPEIRTAGTILMARPPSPGCLAQHAPTPRTPDRPL